jgi:hypothetical protein
MAISSHHHAFLSPVPCSENLEINALSRLAGLPLSFSSVTCAEHEFGFPGRRGNGDGPCRVALYSSAAQQNFDAWRQRTAPGIEDPYPVLRADPSASSGQALSRPGEVIPTLFDSLSLTFCSLSLTRDGVRVWASAALQVLPQLFSPRIPSLQPCPFPSQAPQ